MFDNSQHDDHEDQLRSQKHLNKKALGYRCPSAEGSFDVERAGEKSRCYCCSTETASYLGEEDEKTSNGW